MDLLLAIFAFVGVTLLMLLPRLRLTSRSTHLALGDLRPGCQTKTADQQKTQQNARVR